MGFRPSGICTVSHNGVLYPGKFIYIIPQGVHILYPGELMYIIPRGVHIYYTRGVHILYPGEFIYYTRGVHILYPGEFIYFHSSQRSLVTKMEINREYY